MLNVNYEIIIQRYKIANLLALEVDDTLGLDMRLNKTNKPLNLKLYLFVCFDLGGGGLGKAFVIL